MVIPAYTLVRNGELKVVRCSAYNSETWRALAQYIAREEYPEEDKEEIKIYKIILDDCAMLDADFAAILRAAAKQNIIKSIEYNNNEFGKESLAAVTEILHKRYPNNTLESLTLGYLKTDQRLMF